MSDPFLSEIRIFSFNFAPRNWAFCNGQLLPINQNQALFSLLGTTYGGNGQTTFALPNLQGRVPVHMGSGFTLGQAGGETTHTLSTPEMPQHTHTLQGSGNTANSTNPATGNTYAVALRPVYLAPAAGSVQLAAGAISNIGGGQAHDNTQPILGLNFCIALAGIFPSPN
jgi:microcystin-dependent protein